MTTILGCVPAREHTRAGHPENADRVSAIMGRLESEGVLLDLDLVEPSPASIEQLLLVHTAQLIERVRAASARGGGLLDADTYTTSASFQQARLAAGTSCVLVDRVMGGMANNGIAIIRPPGHHAGVKDIGGFCLFNNVAAAARHAQAHYDIERVVIIDYDVHHGNGTQDIFFADPTVLYISLHLHYPFFYPGSGGIDEIGDGDGAGTTLNIPFGPGVGDRAYRRIFQDLIGPRIAQFKPDIILVSAGFDAHWADPLAVATVSSIGYAQISRDIAEMAAEQCNGKVIFILEGGYHLEALACGVLNLVHVLGGVDEVCETLGPSRQTEPDITNLLSNLQHLHLLS